MNQKENAKKKNCNSIDEKLLCKATVGRMTEKSSSKKGTAATTQAAPGTQQKTKRSTLRIKIITFNQ